MTSLAIQLGSTEVDVALGCIESLPQRMRPTHFDEDELGFHADDRINDTRRFEAFVRTHPEGFFLKKPLWSVDAPHEGFRRVCLYGRTKIAPAAARAAFDAFVPACPVFGYAASKDEYRHRNRVVKDLPEVIVESWAGRDLRLRLPGLYWMTLLSRAHFEPLGVDVDALIRHPKITAQELGDLVILQAYPRAEDWADNADWLDTLCEATPGVFSVKALAHELASVQSENEMDEALARLG